MISPLFSTRWLFRWPFGLGRCTLSTPSLRREFLLRSGYGLGQMTGGASALTHLRVPVHDGRREDRRHHHIDRSLVELVYVPRLDPLVEHVLRIQVLLAPVVA